MPHCSRVVEAYEAAFPGRDPQTISVEELLAAISRAVPEVDPAMVEDALTLASEQVRGHKFALAGR